MNKVKLFCIPYAGGSAVIYSKWKTQFPSWVEVVPLELAGRGVRIVEPIYNDLDAAVEDLYARMLPQINDGEYAIFGHSMGAMLAFEIAHKLEAANKPSPLHVFFSGRSAPHIEVSEEKKYHLLGEEAFKEKVLSLGGTPPEFFQHPELMEVFLPLLRNDFKLAATNLCLNGITPFEKDITVFLGKEEQMNANQAHEWKDHTNGMCVIHYFNGGHFFLNDESDKMIDIMTGMISAKRRKSTIA